MRFSINATFNAILLCILTSYASAGWFSRSAQSVSNFLTGGRGSSSSPPPPPPPPQAEPTSTVTKTAYTTHTMSAPPFFNRVQVTQEVTDSKVTVISHLHTVDVTSVKMSSVTDTLMRTNSSTSTSTLTAWKPVPKTTQTTTTISTATTTSSTVTTTSDTTLSLITTSTSIYVDPVWHNWSSLESLNPNTTTMSAGTSTTTILDILTTSTVQFSLD